MGAAALTRLCLLAAAAAGHGESAGSNAGGEAASGEAASGDVASGEPTRPSPGRDVCGQAKQVGLCFVSWTSEEAEFGERPSEYTRVAHLSNEFRVSWTAYRPTATEAGYISVLLQARTTGWMAIGLRAASKGHGMSDNDVWFARVVDGKAEAIDSWSETLFPDHDTERGGTNDLYDVDGEEVDGITSVRFKRLLNTSDRWDCAIGEGEMPLVYALSRQNADGRLYHGPGRGFARAAFLPPADAPCTDARARSRTSRG